MQISRLLKIAVAFVGSILWLPALAQDETHPHICGTTEAVQKSLEEHPELLNNVRKLDAETIEFLTGEKAMDSILTIPVVFHVFHTYGGERISEDQMKDCIRILNADFNKLSHDTGSITAAFKGIVGNAQFRFRLAQKSPTGKCTKGIEYINSGLHTAGGENLKVGTSWDTKRYLNIWVCSVVASGAAAYAYYPGTAPGQNNEGIVSRSDYVGSIGTSNNGYGARTLTHETGHYFNLPHTWGSSNTPGLASNCSMDDGVADTPNCIGVVNTTCNLLQNTCGQLDNVENYMEYSNCRRMFTKGQVTRMQAAINSATGFRSSLWKGTNLIFTGTTNDGPGPECPATSDFKASASRVCVNVPVTFTQLAYNVNDKDALQFNWTFNGGTPATSTAKVQQVTFAQPGVYDVKLVVQNAAGKDSLTRTALIKVLPDNTAYFSGETESFEATTFPTFPSNPEKNWDIISATTNTWKRTTTADVTGSASLMVTNTSNSTGLVHTMYSPLFEITGSTTGAKLAFKYAYARRNSENTDKLTVSYSVDCGKTWSSAFNRSGASLVSTLTTEFFNGSFVPSATQWKQANASLLFLNGNPKVRFRFEFTSDGGNNIYIEDVQLTAVTAVSNLEDESLGLTVAPNPTAELPRLLIDNVSAQAATIEIVDVLGRSTVLTKSIQLSEGRSEIDLSKEMTKPQAGAYWVRLKLANRIMVRKWVVLP